MGANWTRIDVGSEPESAGRARAALRLLLTEHGWTDERVEEVCVAVSELVNNAVLHGRGLVSLLLGWDCDALQIQVGDSSADMPQRRPPGDGAGGRGLVLVDALADGWGATRLGGGAEHKRVWARFEAGPR